MTGRKAVRIPSWMRRLGPAGALAVAVARERGAMRFYADLARRAGDRVVLARFRFLAAEEAGHARVLAGMARSLGRRREALPAGLSEVKRPPEGQTTRAALETALEAERAAQALYRSAARLCAGVEARAVFERLAAAEEQHEQMIRLELRAQLGVAEWAGLEGRVWAEEQFW
jgi:rubrerythrin